jgi:hypothetical protein
MPCTRLNVILQALVFLLSITGSSQAQVERPRSVPDCLMVCVQVQLDLRRSVIHSQFRRFHPQHPAERFLLASSAAAGRIHAGWSRGTLACGQAAIQCVIQSRLALGDVACDMAETSPRGIHGAAVCGHLAERAGLDWHRRSTPS